MAFNPNYDPQAIIDKFDAAIDAARDKPLTPRFIITDVRSATELVQAIRSFQPNKVWPAGTPTKEMFEHHHKGCKIIGTNDVERGEIIIAS